MLENTLKYLRTPENQIYCFYTENNSIYYRIFYQSYWGDSHELAQNALSNFTVCNDENTIFVLYALSNGAIHISRTKNGRNWDDKVLFQNKPEEIASTIFIMTVDKSCLRIIFNAVLKETKENIFLYTVFENGKWEKPVKIGTFLPFSQKPYFYSMLEKQHYMLYYRTNETTVAAKEILLCPFTTGKPHTLIQMPAPCVDMAFLTDENKIHMLYILQGFFTCQVIYKYKSGAKISSPRVLWEGPVSESCTVFKIKTKLWLLWTSKKQPYYCTSDDDGLSFTNPSGFRDWFPSHPIKSDYICQPSQKKELNLAHVYAESGAGDKIGVIPAVYPSFYPGFTKNTISSASCAQNKKNAFSIENHIKQYESLCKEKDMQIMALSKTLSERNDALSSMNVRFKKQVLQLKNEKEQLEHKIGFMDSENNRLKKTIAYLEEKYKTKK